MLGEPPVSKVIHLSVVVVSIFCMSDSHLQMVDGPSHLFVPHLQRRKSANIDARLGTPASYQFYDTRCPVIAGELKSSQGGCNDRGSAMEAFLDCVKAR